MLTVTVIDGDTQLLDAALSLTNMQMEGVSNSLNGKRGEVKDGKFRELVPENTDVYVYAFKLGPRGELGWSHFYEKVRLRPGEERSLDIKLYKNGTP